MQSSLGDRPTDFGGLELSSDMIFLTLGQFKKMKIESQSQTYLLRLRWLRKTLDRRLAGINSNHIVNLCMILYDDK